MGGKAHLLFEYLLLVCLSLCLVLPGMALGQEEEDEFMLEDVIVTSEKREAEVQSIPMTISVVRELEMRMYNINQVYDLQKMLPDLGVYTAAGTYNYISIREVQTNLLNPIYETMVATHLDGMQLARITGLDNFFFDLERVEVMQGPQGTLYGRGSTAGSMNMITRKPILGDFGGNAAIEAGNYGRIRGDWALNVPLGDKMAMRLAGRRRISDGYSDTGWGDSDTWSNRLSWRYEPNDRIIINMMVDYVEQDDNGQPTYGFNADGYVFDTYGDVEIVAAPPDQVLDARFQSGGPVYARGQANWAMQNASEDNNVHNEHYGIQGSASYAGDVMTATLEWGHRSTKERKPFMWGGARLTATGDGPPFTQVYVSVTTPSQFYDAKANGNTNAMEVRFASNTTIPAGDKIEWIVGAMAQRDRTYQRLDFGFAPVWWDVQIKTHTEGLFAQASWMPFEKWNFTGGLRYNSDAKYYYGNYNQRGDIYDNSSAEWTEFTYRGNISYFFSDDIMPYLTYSKGYRPGQLDYTGFPLTEEILNAWEVGIKSRFLNNKLQFNAVYYLYDYENYSTFGNISKCWEDDNGDHECDDVGGNPEDGYGEYDPATGIRYPDGEIDNYDYEYAVQTSYSAGGADQQGVHVDITYLPTMNDRLFLTATWRNNEYSSPYDPRKALLAMYPDADSVYRDYMEGADIGGYEFGRQATVRGNVSYSHTFRFDGGDTLMARGTAFYEGEGIDQVVNRSFPNEYFMPGTEAYWTGDVSFVYNSSRWMSPGNLWSLRFSINNITDEDALWRIGYSDAWGRYSDAYPEGSGTITGSYINPRTYSLAFEINF